MEAPLSDLQDLDIFTGRRWKAQLAAEKEARATGGQILGIYHLFQDVRRGGREEWRHLLDRIKPGHYHSTAYEFSGTVTRSGPHARAGEHVIVSLFPGRDHHGPITPQDMYLAVGMELSYPESVLTPTHQAILVDHLFGITEVRKNALLPHADEQGHFTGTMEDDDLFREYVEAIADHYFSFINPIAYDPGLDSITLLANGYLPDGTAFPLYDWEDFQFHGGARTGRLYGVVRKLEPDRELASGTEVSLDEGACEIPEVALALQGGHYARETLRQISREMDLSIRIQHPYHLSSFNPERTVARQRSFQLGENGVELISRAVPFDQDNNFLVGRMSHGDA